MIEQRTNVRRAIRPGVLAMTVGLGLAISAGLVAWAAPDAGGSDATADGDAKAAGGKAPAASGEQPAPADSEDGKGRRGRRGQGERGPGGPGGRGNPAERLDRMRETIGELDLTDEQKTQIDQIVAKAKEEVAAMMPADAEGDNPEARRAARGKVRGYMQGLREKIGAVLTEEQRTALQQKMDARRGGGPGGPGGPGGGRMLERGLEIVKKLDLTEEQTKQVDALYTDTKTKLDELRAKRETAGGEGGDGTRPKTDDGKADKAKAGEGDRPRRGGRGGGPEVRALMQEHREKLMEILTDEQQTKLGEMMRAEFGERRGPGGGRGDRPGEGRGRRRRGGEGEGAGAPPESL